ncbi:putative glycerol-3-phosphate ABC transporter, permease protein [Alkalihalophilus pseudofirmus OF4]|uniref:Glycerol-3-phosphate ABC transporter, permease protein n=3 Tax=Alkalihalophilus TaxID=2893060 RepID=D3FXU6_ALKPO|nr:MULTISPECIES: carbohydrate ABC transporter permease [Alkalihalophilus]ADC48933.1 putative glycerol-3-phosphate ABC transporter, permease protein [Alkalihalophilus pseudofirmus OF4]ERN52423.1 glycerol-3-phosphate ABC transporter permease [Alkalihalophilus marmarensis DSM 21297]MDV2886065.1 carbohydrate ABC transporter permease [Alkalihalophilus pseudofirmus]MED1600135.1 carbohydrate ABC transporter permease [Alkalihalophilus marmarensis]OLS35368.1 glycerol-3-phosphate ABC transporter permeas
MMKKIILYILLIASALAIFFPILYAFSASLMSTREIFSGALIPASPSVESYGQAFNRVPLLQFLTNSFIVSFVVMIGQLIVCSLAAYAFVFIPFKGRGIIFALFISTMLIPWEATVIPNYFTILNLGWVNTYQGLTVPFFALAFGIFLLRQHFLTIPKEIFESAQMDGCSRFRFYWNFVLPLSKSTLSALGIYGFLTTWNMYLWPLLVTSNNDVRTVQIGLKMMIAQESSTSWNMVMAAVVMILLPTLLLLFFGLKHIRKGLMAGAIKG